MDIEPESKFFWKFILNILLTPFRAILLLFGKGEARKLGEPFTEAWQFFWEAKATAWLIVVTTVTTVAAWTLLDDKTGPLLLNYTTDLFQPARWYSIITSGFIHASWSHLGWNMLFLFAFGRIVERNFGPWKTLLAYFVAMIVSSIADMSINLTLGNANIGALGASGAIMGLVSAGILAQPLTIVYEALIPMPAMFLGWISIYGDAVVAFGASDGVAHFAHLGGYASVLALFWFLQADDRAKLKKGLLINILSIAIYLTITMAFGITFFNVFFTS